MTRGDTGRHGVTRGDTGYLQGRGQDLLQRRAAGAEAIFPAAFEIPPFLWPLPECKYFVGKCTDSLLIAR